MATPVRHPEPVPPATQLVALPFVSAIAGYLEGTEKVPNLRVTLHRVMDRDGIQYLQQACSYMPIREETLPPNIVGRIMEVTTGIIGPAYDTGKIWRTRRFANQDALMKQLAADMKAVNDTRSVTSVATSYLAIPFVGLQDEAVLVLYADCNVTNFFADDSRIERIRDMGQSFCTLLDTLQSSPLPTLRNFPVSKGEPLRGEETKYPGMQEAIDILPPRLKKVRTFNYEASAG
jgi:hypothetical protein